MYPNRKCTKNGLSLVYDNQFSTSVKDLYMTLGLYAFNIAATKVSYISLLYFIDDMQLKRSGAITEISPLYK